MINIGTLDPGIGDDIANVIKTLSRKSVDGTLDKVLKHVLGNTADSSAISNTNSETNFSLNSTLSISQFFPGRIFKLSACGVYSTTGTPTLTFRVKFGSTNLVVFGAKTGISAASNQSWRIESSIVCRTTGASGTVMAYGSLFINTSANTDTVETVVNNSATTVDTTANQTLQVSLTWSAASTSNTATMKNFVVYLSDY